MLEQVITAGALSMLLLDGFKWLFRVWILKNPEFNFSEKFYLVAVPVLNVLMIPVLALLGVAGATMPTDWLGFARTIVIALIASLISVGGYDLTLKPLKAYGRALTNKG